MYQKTLLNLMKTILTYFLKQLVTKRLNKRTKEKDNDHTIFVNAVWPIVHTSTTIKQL